jgi:hypothetical protein
LTPTARSEIIAFDTIACFDNRGYEVVKGEPVGAVLEFGEVVCFEMPDRDARMEEIRDDTTKAAEEERPEPVGTVPSIRIWRDLNCGLWLWLWGEGNCRWPRYPALK